MVIGVVVLKKLQELKCTRVRRCLARVLNVGVIITTLGILPSPWQVAPIPCGRRLLSLLTLTEEVEVTVMSVEARHASIFHKNQR